MAVQYLLARMASLALHHRAHKERPASELVGDALRDPPLQEVANLSRQQHAQSFKAWQQQGWPLGLVQPQHLRRRLARPQVLQLLSTAQLQRRLQRYRDR